MSVELLQTLSLVLLILSGVFLLISAILFFVFRIPSLIADLTGIAAKKGIAAIKQRSEDDAPESKSGKIGSGEVNLPDSGKLISPIGTSPVTTKLDAVPMPAMSVSPNTTVLNTSVSSVGSVQQQDASMLPVLFPGRAFTVVKEFSFTSSEEIIE